MQISMLAEAAFLFGPGAAMCLSDASVELRADTGAVISFGDDAGAMSIDAGGLELEDLSIYEGGVSIGGEGSGTYTKLGEGTIQAGKFSITMTSENTVYMKGVGNIFIDNGQGGLGAELNEEGMEILSEVGDEPDLKITGESLTFSGESGASQLESEDLIFFDDAVSPAPSATFSAGGIEFASPGAAVQFINTTYNQLEVELMAKGLRIARSQLLPVDQPSDAHSLAIINENFVNKIVAISNIDSIEFNRNNNSNTQINRLCTSEDASLIGYAFSDNHVISLSAAMNLIDAKAGIDLEGRVDILEEWMDNSTDPESMIVGPESDVICTSQNIALEIHNVPQPPTTWKGISINLHSNSQYAFILDQTSTSCNLLRWDLNAQTQTFVFTGLEDMYCFNRWFMRTGQSGSSLGPGMIKYLLNNGWQAQNNFTFHALYDLDRQAVSHMAYALQSPLSNPLVGSDGKILPFYRWYGWIKDGEYSDRDFFWVANTIEKNWNANNMTQSTGLGDVFWTLATVPRDTIFLLNVDYTWTSYNSSVGPCNIPYDLSDWGRFLYGVSPVLKIFWLFCENCITYMANRNLSTFALNTYWKDDHSGIQPRWICLNEDRCLIVDDSNICYSRSTVTEYVKISNFPPGKILNQVWKEFTRIYCNISDLGIYQLGENDVWIPIFNVMPVKNKITMDLDNIHLDTSGQINLTVNSLIFNGFKFSTGDGTLILSDSDTQPIMTITKGVGIKFNYPIIT
jgi:hypothetical protein